MNRQVSTKLDHFQQPCKSTTKKSEHMTKAIKNSVKEYHDKWHNTKRHTLKIGDAVVVKRENKCKAQTSDDPYIYIITYTKGSQIEAKRIKDERTINRDASKFKHHRHVKVQQNKPDIPPDKVPSVSNTVEVQRRLQRRLQRQNKQKLHKQPATMFHHPDNRNV